MSGHTPGPWFAGRQCEISGWVDISIAGCTRNPVASATPAAPGGPHERRDIETRANARLIAAAPDLFSVAHAVDAVADRMDYEPDSQFGELVNAARAAIAKATGAAP